MSTQKVIAVFVAVCAALLFPIAGLAIFGAWLLVTAPVIFGITLFSGLTFLVMKSLVFSGAVFGVLFLAVVIHTLLNKKETKPAEDKVLEEVQRELSTQIKAARG